MNWRIAIVVVWLLALAIHHAVGAGPRDEVAPGMRSLDLAADEGRVRVAFHDQNPDADDSVLLLHGSPGAAGNFDELRVELPSDLRVITPDLPGFGSSTRALQDYSFTRHASDMLALLDTLGIGPVHIVGMSMGGGVALEMARMQPERARSITLLSSIGFQEYELTGDYWSNRVLHVAQCGLVWSIDHLVPHFGLLDSGGQAWSYVRNFLDSDQRDLERVILGWDGPALIVHGERDFLVPAGAARAHAKAMPQARLELYPEASHFLIWTRPVEVAAVLASFFRESNAIGGSSASLRLKPELTPLAGPGRWLALGMAALGVALVAPVATWWFVPFAVLGRLELPLLLIAFAAGVVLRATPGGWRSPSRVLGRVGLRAVAVALHAGLLFALAAVVDLRTALGFLVALLLWFAGAILWQARTPVGRARLRGRYLRLRRWEYWPAWLVYAPIVPRLCWRARRFGGLRVTTSVNPAIPLGGLVGESKSQILREIGRRDQVPRWMLVEAGDLEGRRRAVDEFAGTLDERWPIVLKPDRGERGVGVRIVRSDEERDAVLGQVTIPIIAQEYLPGLEFGVFWFRRPGAAQGELFSVSRKAPVFVTGDGASSLDRLLCAHDRIVPFLDHLRDVHRENLDSVPAEGESLQVTELGTHCLGATFLDSMELRSEELTRALDSVMSDARLDFGRFDLRVPTDEDLVAGRNLKLIEFNGLSGEAAHLYDPENPLSEARTILLEQWTLALEIGSRNRVNGVEPAGWWQILRVLRSHARDRGQRGG